MLPGLSTNFYAEIEWNWGCCAVTILAQMEGARQMSFKRAKVGGKRHNDSVVQKNG